MGVSFYTKQPPVEKINFGRAHHRVIYFVGKQKNLTIKELLSILKITKKHCNKTNKPRLLTYCKEEDGTFAVFTEQGASASNMAAAKVLDAIARLPGNDGEDSDAIGAYTQVKLSDMMSECTKTKKVSTTKHQE